MNFHRWRIDRGTAAVAGYFAINGVIMSSWVPRIPQVRDALHMRPAVLGGVLLMAAVGALVGMPLTGALAARWDARRMTILSAVAYCFSLIGIGLAKSPVALGLALVLSGFSNGALDVAMNTLASAVEREAGRVIMPWFHGMFSLGSLLGAAIGTLAAALEIAPATQFFWEGIVFALISFMAGRWAPRPRPKSGVASGEPQSDVASGEPQSGDASGGPAATRWRGLRAVLVPFGVTAFAVLLAEGAMADWSALYLTDELGASAGAAAGGYLAFALAMTSGRLVGSGLTARFGVVGVFRAGGSAFAAGILLLLLFPKLAIAGCLVVGLGLSCLFPLLVSKVAEASDWPAAQSVAAVSVIGYFGFLAGPPAIGFFAEIASLRVALSVLVLAPIPVLLFARRIGISGRTR